MSKRISRVNELLQREISEQMRRFYRDSAVAITISDVSTNANLRSARIYYAIFGDQMSEEEAKDLFRRIGPDLQQRVSKCIILKYFPKFEFIYDASLERGANVIDLLNELDEESQ